MTRTTTPAARHVARLVRHLHPRRWHLALAVVIEVTLAVMHLPIEVHTAAGVVAHTIAELLR